MRELNWYVYRIGGYLYRIRCEPFYMKELYSHQAADEYIRCKDKEEAVELCCKFNRKKNRRTKNYEEI